MKSLFSIKTLVAVFLACFLAWQIYVFLRPAPRQLSKPEIGAVETACEDFAEQLRLALPEDGGPVRIGLGHLLNDAAGQATEALRATLDERARWTVDDRSIPRAIVSDVFGAVVNASSLEQIAGAGDRVKLDLLVAGRVREVAPAAGDAARAELELLAYDTRSGETRLHRRFAADWRPGMLDNLRFEIAGIPFWQRALLWVAAVLLLPWATPFLTHKARDQRSNAASFCLVGGYVALALLLAGLLTGFRLDGAGDWLLLLLALLLSGAWNFWSCERIAASR